MQERMKPKNQLRLYWWKAENDVGFHYPKRKCDGALLHYFFDVLKIGKGDDARSLLEELDHRGYDLETLKFSIAYKAPAEGSTGT